MTERDASWWTGRHGEWYVVAQLVFMALIFFGPRSTPAFPSWPFKDSAVWTVVGGLLMVCGGAFLGASIFYLRRGLTPLPYPTAQGALIQTGPYAVVRHPMYAGGLVLALGWALLVHGGLTLLYVAAFGIFINVKCRREERWLRERYSNYAAYEARVRRLIPFLY
jgi:protein-S-isoprenylcysteine O-methyltransferase Ste14